MIAASSLPTLNIDQFTAGLPILSHQNLLDPRERRFKGENEDGGGGEGDEEAAKEVRHHTQQSDLEHLIDN